MDMRKSCVEDSSDPLFCVKMETTPHEESAGASTEDYLVTTSFQGNEGSAPRLEEEGEMDTAQDPVLGWVDDPDAQFLISYLPTFKRLTPRQNALARLKIQQVLYQSAIIGDLWPATVRLWASGPQDKIQQVLYQVEFGDL
uniref:(California timema) hypothetical protein n=1 Tax=Timema californicum TaxID=61474 RepID=A0A7R9JGQ3_TIMCA|nr:unnamed protein product [Timema californicum]